MKSVRDSVILKKPAGTNGEYTFTLKITGTSSVGAESSYKIVYGTSDQRTYFFEDISDSVDLPYYKTVRDIDNEESFEYSSASFPSDRGEYFKINATGTERVTLYSQYEGFYFKILDGDTLETLYNGIDLPTYEYSQYALYKRTDLNLQLEKPIMSLFIIRKIQVRNQPINFVLEIPLRFLYLKKLEFLRSRSRKGSLMFGQLR